MTHYSLCRFQYKCAGSEPKDGDQQLIVICKLMVRTRQESASQWSEMPFEILTLCGHRKPVEQIQRLFPPNFGFLSTGTMTGASQAKEADSSMFACFSPCLKLTTRRPSVAASFGCHESRVAGDARLL